MSIAMKPPMSAAPRARDLETARARARGNARWLGAVAIAFYLAIVAWNLFRGFAAAGAG
jgi:hypothetical protein